DRRPAPGSRLCRGGAGEDPTRSPRRAPPAGRGAGGDGRLHHAPLRGFAGGGGDRAPVGRCDPKAPPRPRPLPVVRGRGDRTRTQPTRAGGPLGTLVPG